MAQRLKIGDRVYTEAALDEVSIKDLLVFDPQVAALGLPYRWKDVEKLGEEFAQLEKDGKKAEMEGHPDGLFFLAVVVWVTRRTAGEDITFDEAISVPMSKIEWLPDPKDHAPKKKARKSTQPSVAAESPVEDEEPAQT